MGSGFLCVCVCGIVYAQSSGVVSNGVDWSNSSDMLAVLVSLITIVAALGAVGRKIFGESEVEKRMKVAETEIHELKKIIGANHKEMTDLMGVMRTELSDKVSQSNYGKLVSEHMSLEDTVNEGIDKRIRIRPIRAVRARDHRAYRASV